MSFSSVHSLYKDTSFLHLPIFLHEFLKFFKCFVGVVPLCDSHPPSFILLVLHHGVEHLSVDPVHLFLNSLPSHLITPSFFLSFSDHLVPALPLHQHQLQRPRAVVRRMQSCILVYHTPCGDGYACTDVGERSLVSHHGPVASPFAHGTATGYPYKNTTTLDAYGTRLCIQWLPLLRSWHVACPKERRVSALVSGMSEQVFGQGR